MSPVSIQTPAVSESVAGKAHEEHHRMSAVERDRSRERIEINPYLMFKSIAEGMWFFSLFTALEIIKALKGYPC